MGRKMKNSQLTNMATYIYYRDRMLTLAENVFQFSGLSDFVDVSYINKKLLRTGSIAFFFDDNLGLLALPYNTVGSLDIYMRPDKIHAVASNGYSSKTLNRDEFVIMYDNMSYSPMYLNICQLAERMALATRVIDINIAQQRTPRIIKAPQNQVTSVKSMLNNIDNFEDTVLAYDSFDINSLEVVLEPCPYVADKVQDLKEKLWSEFLGLIGITSLTDSKKERLIQDEVKVQLGGTIASRYNRFTPRQRAIDEIYKKFGIMLEVSYYDGMPTTLESLEDSIVRDIDMSINDSEQGGVL